MGRRSWVLCVALILAATAASAETAQRIRGTVASLQGSVLRVEVGGGRDVTLVLAPDYGVSGLVAATPEEVVSGRYVGALATRHANGLLTARELHIFPDSLRGAGAGQRPSDVGSDATVVVSGTVDQGHVDALGGTVTLTYKGGESVVDVPPDVPVVRFVPGRRSMLVPGAHVVISTTPAPGGGLGADHVIVGVDGLVPPI